MDHYRKVSNGDTQIRLVDIGMALFKPSKDNQQKDANVSNKLTKKKAVDIRNIPPDRVKVNIMSLIHSAIEIKLPETNSATEIAKFTIDF